MKVKELKIALEKCDPELDVFCLDNLVKSVTESSTHLAFDLYNTKDGVPEIVTDRYVDINIFEVDKESCFD